MTSSGTYAFSISDGEAVIAAFERCQVRAPEIRQEHMLTARREINLLFSEWSNRQVNLWKVTLYSQLLTAGTATYTLGSEIVMILDGYRSINQGLSTQTDIYMTPISRTAYDSYPLKQTQGPPTVYWFNRQIIPTVTFWPVPDSGGPYYFNYHAVTQIQDAAITSGQTPDIPERWYDVFIAGLAFRLCRIYKPDMRQALKGDYDEAWTFAAAQDTENVSLVIAPNLSRYYR
jgi:hypothetical protein